MRKGRAGERANEQAHSISLSRTLVTPTTSTPPLARGNTSRVFPLVFRLAPTHLGWDALRQIYSSVQGPPQGRNADSWRQVGACCVLTNNFPLSSRWVVSSNLFSPGRCSVSRVSSSCPSTEATTWYSSPHSVTATTTAVSSPDGGELDDVFPPWRKSSIRVCLAAFLAAGGGGGATVARQEAAPRRLSSESTTPAPQRGTCRALSSRLRQRRVSFPCNVPTPSGQMTPALSRRTC
jgi:hypothetical protein